MATRINKRHQDMIREKIKASQLINRLTDHALGDVDMSASQVNAANAVLRKALPDLTSQEIDAVFEDRKADIQEMDLGQITDRLDEVRSKLSVVGGKG